MKVAIIGANSYIARNLIHVFKNEYEEIEVNLYGRSLTQTDGELNYTQVDLSNLEDLNKINLNCDAVFFFVGKTGSANGFDDFDSFIDSNEKTLLYILNEYRRQNSKAKIIFPSTRLVYKGKKGPQREDAEKEFKTVYAINKYACEQYLDQYHRVYDVNYCILRIGVPYGSLVEGASSYGTAEFMLNKAKKGEDISLYGDGSVRRTITYIGDLCHALIEVAISEKCVNDVFNIGGEDFSLKEMAVPIAEKYNVGIKHVKYPKIADKIESGDTVFDDSKIRKLVDIKYKTSFIEWCNKN